MHIIKNRKELSKSEKHELVLDILEAGISAVLPEQAIENFFSNYGSILPQEIVLFAFGKASLRMFTAFRERYKGKIKSGHVVLNPGESIETSEVSYSIGHHPIPSKDSLESAKKLITISEKLTEKDTLVCLISGGGSAMLELPKEGIDLELLQMTYKTLLLSGANIHEMNSVRRSISQIKGGGLAKRAYLARIMNLIISDVIGNKLEDIASGPTVYDASEIVPISVIKKYGLEEKLDKKVIQIIEQYTPIDKKFFQNVETYIIADNELAIQSMIKRAQEKGLKPARFPNYLRGEARLAVKEFMQYSGELIVGGGETTVKVKGNGKGGRNQEFVLAGLENVKDGILASIGTDGIDGNTDAAGALGDASVLETAKAKNLSIKEFLERNDSYSFFQICGGLIFTGPTGANVADISVYLK